MTSVERDIILMPRAERTRLRHGESSNACSIPLHYFSVRRSYLPRAGSGRYTSLSRLVVVKVQERRRVVTASSPPTSPAMRSVSLSAIRSPMCVSSTHDVNQLVHRCHYLVDRRQRGPPGNRCALRSAKTTHDGDWRRPRVVAVCRLHGPRTAKNSCALRA